MARERVLSEPVSIDIIIGGQRITDFYDLVRFNNKIIFEVGQGFLFQKASFDWAIGRLVDGTFVEAPVSSLKGTKVYLNNPPDYAFAVLIMHGPTLALTQDQVFHDLEVDGKIPAGEERDYAMEP